MKAQVIAQEIHDAGLTEAQIAARVQSTQPTIHRIRTGKQADTSASLAERLEALRDALISEGVISQEAAAR